MGHFFNINMDILCPVFQSYDMNLQITSVMSWLAHLPHPNLNEFLLNPYLNVKDDVRSLPVVIRKVRFYRGGDRSKLLKFYINHPYQSLS